MSEPQPHSRATDLHIPASSGTGDRTTPRTNTTGDTPANAETAAPVSVPGYEVLGELGRGGMGVVYHARQVKLNREVALKMVLGEAKGNRRELIRFLAEAEAVAAVKHQNVVQVYDYGESAGRPFLALEYLSGGTLEAYLREHTRLKPTDAAALLAPIAHGVAAAHALGIVHRDLKPGNILLTSAGEPKVSDFGLAKKSGVAGVTQTGAILGTPAYMAPEQADGKTKFVGPQADVWGLGVILYECLVGQRPFRARGVNELFAQIVSAEPEFPRVGKTRLPRDLELICRKCLEKSATDRYSTAADLAMDLERFIAGEPISVRPPGTIERVFKWARRKPTAATAWLLGTAAMVLVAVAVALGFAYTIADRERKTAVNAEATADQQRGKAETARQVAETARAASAEALSREALARQQSDRDKANFEAVSAARAIDIAYREWQFGNVGRAAQMLDAIPQRYRAWEWNYVRRLCQRERYLVPIADPSNVAISPDGSRLLAYTILSGPILKFTQRFYLFDLTTKKELSIPGLPPPDTQVCATTLDSRVPRCVFWGADVTAKGKFAAHVLDPFGPRTVAVIRGIPAERASSWAVTLSADGTRLLARTQDHIARVWNAETGELITTLKGPILTGRNDAEVVSLSPDGALAGFADSHAATVRIWDVKTNQEIAVIKHPGISVQKVVYLPAKRVLLCPPKGPVTGYDLNALDKPTVTMQGQVIGESVQLSPDGSRIAAGCWDHRVRIWETATGRLLQTLSSIRGSVYQLVWNPNSTQIVTGGDRLVRVWDANSGELLSIHRGADKDVKSVTIGPDGRIGVSAAGGVMVFDPRENPECGEIAALHASLDPVLLSRDDKLFAITTTNSKSPTAFYDLATRRHLYDLPTLAPIVLPQGIAIVGGTRTSPILEFYVPRTGERVSSKPLVSRDTAGVPYLVLRVDEQSAVVGIRTSGVKGKNDLMNVKTGDVIGSQAFKLIDLNSGVSHALAELPNLRRVSAEQWIRSEAAFQFISDETVLGFIQDTVHAPEYRWWDRRTGRLIRRASLTGFEKSQIHLLRSAASQYSRDLSVLVTSSFTNGRAIALAVKFDTGTGQEVARLEIAESEGRFCGFSRDGSRALVASPGGELRIVGTKLGQQLLVIPAHLDHGRVATATFTADGTRIITTGGSGTVGSVRIWDGRPPKLQP